MLVIASTAFPNYYALFCNVCYLEYLFLDNIITKDAQRKIIVYTFQLKSFEHNNLTFSQVFRRKKIDNGRGKRIIRVVLLEFLSKKIDVRTLIWDCYLGADRMQSLCMYVYVLCILCFNLAYNSLL